MQRRRWSGNQTPNQLVLGPELPTEGPSIFGIIYAMQGSARYNSKVSKHNPGSYLQEASVSTPLLCRIYQSPVMPKTACPHCHKVFNIKPDHVGKNCTCKGCQQKFTIQLLGPTAAQPSAAQPAPPTQPVAPASQAPETVAVPVAPIAAQTTPIAAQTAPIVQPIAPVVAPVVTPVAPLVAPVVTPATPATPAVPATPAPPTGHPPAALTPENRDSESAYEQLSGMMMKNAAGSGAIGYDEMPYAPSAFRAQNADGVGWMGDQLVMRGSALMAFGAFLFLFALLGLTLWGLEFLQPMGAFIGSAVGLVGSLMVVGGLRSRVGTALLMGGIPCIVFVGLGMLTGHWYSNLGWGEIAYESRNNNSIRTYQPRRGVQRTGPGTNSRSFPNFSPPQKSPARKSAPPPTQQNKPSGSSRSDSSRSVADFFKPEKESAPGRRSDTKPESGESKNDPLSISGFTMPPVDKPKPSDSGAASQPTSPNSETKETNNSTPPKNAGNTVPSDENLADSNPFESQKSSPDTSLQAETGTVAFKEFNGRELVNFRREKSSWHQVWFRARLFRIEQFPAGTFGRMMGDTDNSFIDFVAHSEQLPILGFRFYGSPRKQSLGPIHPVYERGAEHDTLAKPGYVLGGISTVSTDNKITSIRFTYVKQKGNKLDLTDQYNSPWFGSDVARNAPVESEESAGRLVIGIAINMNGFSTDCISLMFK